MKKLFLLCSLLMGITFFADAQILVTRKTASSVPYANANIQLRYSSDLATNYSDRSLPDKRYVDSMDGKQYTALMSQTGTATPTATTIRNSLGSIVWARSSTGVYTGTLSGAFTSGKTFFTIQNNLTDSTRYVFVRTSANVLTLSTYAGAALADALLADTPLQIRVYY